jgi:hypothetical protein
MPIYRCVFMLILVILGTGIAISYFRKYRINYIFIFEVDPKYKMNQYEFYKVFLIFFTVFLACLLGELLSIRGYIAASNNDEKTYFAYGLVIFCIVALINPFRIMYKEFRMALLTSCFYTFIAPFGKVRFRDFFLADIFCSLVKPFIDLYVLGCFFTTDSWKKYDLVPEEYEDENTHVP